MKVRVRGVPEPGDGCVGLRPEGEVVGVGQLGEVCGRVFEEEVRY